MTTDERKKKTDKLTTMLEEGLDRFAQEGEFKDYLDFMTCMHSYSWNNLLLIKMQRPMATQCASKTNWAKVERRVRYDELHRGIMIWRPTFRPATQRDVDNGYAKEVGDDIIIGFVTAKTYDVSQTEGKPVPEKPKVSQTIDGKVLDIHFNALMQMNARINVPVQFISEVEMMMSHSLSARGFYDTLQKRIVVAAAPPRTMTWRVLCHETVHAMDDRLGKLDINSKEEYKTSELVAEGTTYCIGTAIGLDMSATSFGYIAMYLKEETGRAALGKALGRIKTHVSKLLGYLTHDDEDLPPHPTQR